MEPEIAKQPVKPPRLSMKMLHDLIIHQQQIQEQLMKRIEWLEQQINAAVLAPHEPQSDALPSEQDDTLPVSPPNIADTDMPELGLEALIEAALHPDGLPIAEPSHTEDTDLALADQRLPHDSWSCIEIPRSLRHAAPAKKKRIWDKLWHWSSASSSGSRSVTHKRDAQRMPAPRLSLEMPHEPMRLRSSSE